MADIETKAVMFGKNAENKRIRLLTAIMKGTVFSGHPTRTTLFNTLRVISYARFIAHLAAIPKHEFRIYAAGDDICVILNRKYLAAFKRCYKLVYIHDKMKNPENASHGLG